MEVQNQALSTLIITSVLSGLLIYLLSNLMRRMKDQKVKTRQPISLLGPIIKENILKEKQKTQNPAQFDVLKYIEQSKLRKSQIMKKNQKKLTKNTLSHMSRLMEYIPKENQTSFIVRSQEQLREERQRQERAKRHQLDEKQKLIKEKLLKEQQQKLKQMKIQEMQQKKNQPQRQPQQIKEVNEQEIDELKNKDSSDSENPFNFNFNLGGNKPLNNQTNFFMKKSQPSPQQPKKEDKPKETKVPNLFEIKPTQKKEQNQKDSTTPNSLFQNQQPRTIPVIPVVRPTQQLPKEQIKQVPKQNKRNDIELNSEKFLEKIIEYSTSIRQKDSIETKINNLGGAQSNINNIYLNARSFLSRIDKKNDDQVSTFGFKMWDLIVNTFIGKTNVKDGFEKIPSREKNAQVQKNSINKYILVVNMIRYMGGEKVWNCIFGKTLKMMSFIYKADKPPQNHTELQLYKNGYIPLNGDISTKYLTRLDSLTYFLFGLTCFDPLEVIEEISLKTNENFDCTEELRKLNYRWSYKEFWNLFSTIKNNQYDAYHKSILYMNIISTTYLQICKNKRTGHFKEFVSLHNLLIKKGTTLYRKINQTEDFKVLLNDVQNLHRYQFDGEELCDAIKAVCNRFGQKQKELRITDWREYQRKCSIFYYFWREN